MADSKDAASSKQHEASTSTPNTGIDIEKLTDKVYQLMQAEMQLTVRRGVMPLLGNKRRK